MLDMSKIVDNMKANLAKNDAWRKAARASINARKAMVEFFVAAVAATEEARELGINVSVGDGNEDGKDSIEWVRGSKSFHVLRSKDCKLTIRRVFGAGKGETMVRDSDPPSEAELSAWVQNVTEEGADFLSDELQPALPPKKS